MTHTINVVDDFDACTQRITIDVENAYDLYDDDAIIDCAIFTLNIVVSFDGTLQRVQSFNETHVKTYCMTRRIVCVYMRERFEREAHVANANEQTNIVHVAIALIAKTIDND